MPRRRDYFVYIMASAAKGVLYVGVTGNLKRRVTQHQASPGKSFTARYNAHHLVWYEVHDSPARAIVREKQLKAGPRRRKLALIAAMNPRWQDLSGQL